VKHSLVYHRVLVKEVILVNLEVVVVVLVMVSLTIILTYTIEFCSSILSSRAKCTRPAYVLHLHSFCNVLLKFFETISYFIFVRVSGSIYVAGVRNRGL